MSWRERVTAERAELEKKLSDLLAFLCNDAYVLTERDRALLRRQARVMAEYSAVLALRLAAKD